MIEPREFKPATLSHFDHYISLRHFGPYDGVNETWSRLVQFAFHQSIVGPKVVPFGICPVCPGNVFPSELWYDACLTLSPEQHEAIAHKMVAKPEDDLEGIELNTLRVDKTVMTIHRGPYSRLRETYTDAIIAGRLQGFHFEGHRLPTIEIYRNNPLLTKPEALVTEIHFRVDEHAAA